MSIRKSSFLILAVLIIFLSTACFDNAVELDSEKEISLVKFYFEKGRYHDVFIEIEKLPKDLKSDASLNFVLAKTFLKIGNANQAYKIFKQLEGANEIDGLEMWVVESLIQQSKFSEAKKLLLSANIKSLYSGNARYSLLLGQILLAEKNINQARDVFEEISDSNDEYYSAQVWLSRVDVAERKKARALERIEKLLAKSQDISDAWLLKGDLKFADGEFDVAENSYLQVLRLDNSNVLSKKNLSIAQSVVSAKVAQGNLDGASSFYKTFVESYPKTSTYFFELGKLAYSENNYQMAEQHLKAIYKNMPDTKRVVLLLAQVLAMQNKYVEAGELLSQNLSSDGDNFEILIYKSVVDLKLNDMSSVVDYLKKYSDTSEEHKKRLLPLLSYLYFLSNNGEKFKELFADYDIDQPQSLSIVEGIRSVFSSLGSHDHAENLLHKMIEVYPNKLELKIMYLNALEAAGKESKFAKVIEQWITSQPDNSSLKLLLMNSHLKIGERDAAISHLVELKNANLSKEQVNILVNLLSLTAIQTNDVAGFNELIKLVEFWSTKYSENSRLRLMLANLYVTNNMYTDAIPFYEEIVQRNASSPEILNNLAWSYYEVGDSRALKTAEKAYSSNSSNASICDTFGWILVQTGEVSRGIEVLKQALEIEPNNIAIQEHLIAATKKL